MNGARMRSYSLAGTRPAMHQPLGAAADRAEERPHPHLAGRGRGDRLLAQFGPAGTDIPERFAQHRVIIPAVAAGLV